MEGQSLPLYDLSPAPPHPAETSTKDATLTVYNSGISAYTSVDMEGERAMDRRWPVLAGIGCPHVRVGVPVDRGVLLHVFGVGALRVASACGFSARRLEFTPACCTFCTLARCTQSCKTFVPLWTFCNWVERAMLLLGYIFRDLSVT